METSRMMKPVVKRRPAQGKMPVICHDLYFLGYGISKEKAIGERLLTYFGRYEGSLTRRIRRRRVWELPCSGYRRRLDGSVVYCENGQRLQTRIVGVAHAWYKYMKDALLYR